MGNSGEYRFHELEHESNTWLLETPSHASKRWGYEASKECQDGEKTEGSLSIKDRINAMQMLLECQMFGIILTVMVSGRGVTLPVFLLRAGLGLALATKSCSGQRQAFKRVNNNQTSPQEKTTSFVSFDFQNRFQVLQGMPVKHFAPNVRRTDCAGQFRVMLNAEN